MKDLPSDETQIVVQWLEMFARGVAPSLDEFCARVPSEQRARVRDACAAAATAHALLTPGSPGSPKGALGTHLGDFELLEEIGRGGMGVVYRARQVSLERIVAVKVLALGKDESARRIERFRVEALASARIDDPRIVKVLAIGYAEGMCYIAMEFVAGHSLYQEFARQREQAPRVPPAMLAPRDAAACRRIAAFFAEIAGGLAAAHKAGVLHRDVQPGNVLIDPQGRPRLIDFGLARVLDRPSQTRTGEVAGTPLYMSPEQVRAAREEIDHRSDVFSLGVVLYEALTLTRAFEGRTSQQVMARIVLEDPERVDRKNTAVPADLAVLCAKAMEKEPAQRFRDAQTFADELRRVADGVPILSIAPSRLRRVARFLRRRALVFAILGVALLAAGTGAFCARARPATAVFVVDRQDLVGVTILAQEIDTLPWTLGAQRRLGAAPLRVELPIGEYRFWLVRGQAFAELTRSLRSPGATYDVGRAQLESVTAVRGGMAEVPGGPFVFGNSDQDFPGREVQTVTIDTYLIDEAEVSNAEYRRYLEATGASAPSLWPVVWRQVWQPAWDVLPAAGVPYDEARAYAEWAGKRLPTEKEWEKAARGVAGWLLPWRPDFDRDDVLRRCNVGKVALVRTPDWPPRWANYLQATVAVRSGDDTRSPFGLYHTVGNVSEWTESLMSDVVDGRPILLPGYAVARGAAWDDEELRWSLNRVAYASMALNQQFRGFRCAKSGAPPMMAD